MNTSVFVYFTNLAYWRSISEGWNVERRNEGFTCAGRALNPVCYSEMISYVTWSATTLSGLHSDGECLCPQMKTPRQMCYLKKKKKKHHSKVYFESISKGTFHPDNLHRTHWSKEACNAFQLNANKATGKKKLFQIFAA